MQAARLKLKIVDAATKVFLDTTITIETYGHANAMHGFDLDDDSLVSAPNNETFCEQFKALRTLIESQRGEHSSQTMSNIYIVSPNHGSADTYANGNRGGVNDPFLTIQDCIDNAVTDSNHDIVIVNSDAAVGPTTYTETITCDKRYMFLRGPGRDCVLTRTGDSLCEFCQGG